MILAIFYLLIGLSASILIFIKRPKIEIQIPKEFEQLEKDIAKWLETPSIQVKKKIPITSSLDVNIEEYPSRTILPAIPSLAFNSADHVQNVGQEVM